MNLKFRIREKFVSITIAAILLSVGVTAYLNLRDFIRLYKESVSERIFAQCHELTFLIEDITELGLRLGELKGLDKECQKIVESVPYARYCFITNVNDNRAYYHNLPEEAGKIYDDAVTLKAGSVPARIIQEFRTDAGEMMYDFSLPFKTANGRLDGRIRLGVLTDIVYNEVSRLQSRVLLLSLFFIILGTMSIVYFVNISILRPIKKLIQGISVFGRGELDTKIDLKT
ncbi:MAG: hypothetical protein JW800_06700, partial [Candidatus Omnitrophica bacterium]|nr:hypothetical protein [Candidatus Omnitrophota bacterium]